MHYKHSLQNKSKSKPSGLMWQWILSYTSVLLMPILICSFYYFHSYNLVEQRTLSNQHLILENSKEQIDSAFYDAINLSNHLQLNSYINMLAHGKCAVDSTPALDRHYLSGDLKMLQVSNALIQQLNVYFPASDYIVTAASAHEMSMLPYMDNVGISFQDWQQILEELDGTHIVCMTPENSSCLVLAKTLQSDIHGAPLAVMAVQLDRERLIHKLQNDLFPEFGGVFALIKTDGVLLSSDSGSAVFEELSFPSIFTFFDSRDDGSLYDTSTASVGKSYLIDFYPTLIPEVGLISVTDKSVYKADLYKLLEVLLFTLTVCVITGLFVIFYFSRRNYKPVEQIVHYIKGYGGDDDNDTNEYHLIMKILTHNQSELEKQRALLRNNYVQKILTGEIAFHQISGPVAEAFSLHFPADRVCVLLLSPETTQKSGFSSEPSPADNTEQLVYFIIENVLKELLSGQFPDNYFCIQHRQIAVITCIPGEAAQPEQSLEHIVQELFSFLTRNYQIELKAGISSIHHKDGLSTAYLQADAALEYIKLFGNHPLCHYASIPQEQEIGAIHLNTSDYVVNLILSGSQPQLSDYFSTLRRDLESSRLSSADARSCYYFFYQVTARLRLYCQTHYSFIPSCLDFIGDTFFQIPLPELLTQVQEAFQKASEQLQEKKEMLDNNRWGTDIRRFIQNNYFDADLNLNTLAEHFHISPSYLSKKYKEQYQSSVIDYLYEVRIRNSIQLIQDTNMKVTEVAQMVGFPDSNAFIRIFKKITGITPGKYKAELISKT